MQWEYLLLRFDTRSYEEIQTVLSGSAAQGWELVTVDGGMAYFKRSLDATAPNI